MLLVVTAFPIHDARSSCELSLTGGTLGKKATREGWLVSHTSLYPVGTGFAQGTAGSHTAMADVGCVRDHLVLDCYTPGACLGQRDFECSLGSEK